MSSELSNPSDNPVHASLPNQREVSNGNQIPSGLKRRPIQWRKPHTWLILFGAMVGLCWLTYQAPLGREFAVRCLGKIGTPSVPILRRALGDADRDVVRAASEQLLAMGTVAVPSLMNSINNKDVAVRIQTIRALVIAGAHGLDVADAILAATSDLELSVRRVAITALGSVGANADVAIPVLIRALKDKDFEIRLQAIEALEHFGPLAIEAVPALQEAANDPDPRLRSEAAETLHEITGPSSKGTSADQ